MMSNDVRRQMSRHRSYFVEIGRLCDVLRLGEIRYQVGFLVFQHMLLYDVSHTSLSVSNVDEYLDAIYSLILVNDI